MSKRSQFIRLGAAAALCALVPALSLADAGSTRTTAHGHTPQPTDQGRAISVSSRFSQTLNNGCQYVATLQGTLRELTTFELAQMGLARRGEAAQPGHAGDAVLASMLYRPNLRFNTRVTCTSGPSQQGADYTIAGVPISWEQLQRVLQEGGRIVSYEGGPVCSYSPEYSFQGGRLTATGVLQSCETPTARGGGPVPDASPPGMLPSNPVVPSANGSTPGGSASDTLGVDFDHARGQAGEREQSGGLSR